MIERFYPTVICIALLLSPIPLGNAAVATPEAAQTKAWEVLRAGVNHGHVDKRCEAVRALGLLSQDSEAIKLAEDVLLDKHPEVRSAAASALGEMRSTASIPQLKKALSDPEIAVALAAAHSLVILKDQAGYEVYYAVLTGKCKGSEGLNPEVLIQEQLQKFDECNRRCKNEPRYAAEAA